MGAVLADAARGLLFARRLSGGCRGECGREMYVLDWYEFGMVEEQCSCWFVPEGVHHCSCDLVSYVGRVMSGMDA